MVLYLACKPCGLFLQIPNDDTRLIHWGIPRVLPWDPLGKIQGFPAGPHDKPWDPANFLWDPAESINNTHDKPWDISHVRVGYPTGP